MVEDSGVRVVQKFHIVARFEKVLGCRCGCGSVEFLRRFIGDLVDIRLSGDADFVLIPKVDLHAEVVVLFYTVHL